MDLEDHGEQELALAGDLWGMVALSPRVFHPRNPSHHAAKPCPPPPDQPDAPTPEASPPCSGCQLLAQQPGPSSSQSGEEPPETTPNRACCSLGPSVLTSLETSTTRSSLLSPSLSCTPREELVRGPPSPHPRLSLKHPLSHQLESEARAKPHSPRLLLSGLVYQYGPSARRAPGPVPGHLSHLLAASPTPAPIWYF